MSATGTVDVLVPDIGDFQDVPVIEILVSPGDTVAADDPLVTLESDKATMDVPAPLAGKVQELQVSVGDAVSEGTLLLRMAADAGGAAPETASAEPGAPGAVPPAEPDVAGAPEATPPAEVPDAPPATVPSELATPAPEDGHGTASTVGSPAAAPRGRASAAGGPVYASPSVRRRARERGIDLSRVRGTGRNGRITVEDLDRPLDGAGAPGEAAAAPAAAGAAPAGAVSGPAGLVLAPWPRVDFERYGPVERQPRSRIQKISAPNLARNWVMIPHVTHNDEADITELEAFRQQVNQEHARDGVKLTMVGLLITACVATLKEFPAFNSSLDGEDLVIKRYYNIGFAADTPGGLVVPVIKDADSKGILTIARELTALSAKAREGKLGPGDMAGGTFTISSLGGIGGTSFTPIINAPEVAILGVTRSAMRPVWNPQTAAFEPRLMVPLSLSYDHRVIDGAAAARFTAHLGKVLADLRRALL